ncbi:MAG: hypothetical protein PWQ17_2032 [Anaerophaga sp.]|nr:hypothetical protein [Anaerophaga sp.]
MYKLKITIKIIIIIMLVFACNREKLFVIKGKVHNAAFEGEKVYLVSSDAPVTKNVDSIEVKDGRFQFEIHSDSQTAKIIRIPPKYPDIVQDLVVIPEEGTIEVELAQRSKGKGTPLNNCIQAWKQKKEMYDSIQWSLYRQIKTAGLSDSEKDSIESYINETEDLFIDEVMCTIDSNLHNGIGLFLFKIYFHSFPAEFKNKVLSETGDLYFKKDKQLEKIIRPN